VCVRARRAREGEGGREAGRQGGKEAEREGGGEGKEGEGDRETLRAETKEPYTTPGRETETLLQVLLQVLLLGLLLLKGLLQVLLQVLLQRETLRAAEDIEWIASSCGLIRMMGRCSTRVSL